jgi:hypothetical protein
MIDDANTPKRAGRPKAKLDLPEGWQNSILSLYRQGASDVEVRAWILEQRTAGTFSPDLWDRWIEEEPEFSAIIKAGRMLAHSWWEREGRTSIKAQHFQPGLYTLNMVNRYGWNSNKGDTKLDAAGQLIEFMQRVMSSGDGQTRGLPEKK